MTMLVIDTSKIEEVEALDLAVWGYPLKFCLIRVITSVILGIYYLPRAEQAIR